LRDNTVFIRHILDEIHFIANETRDLTLDRLENNETLKRALLRSLEIIGEAAKNVSGDFRGKYPEIKWKEMAGLRDKLIHFYFGVDWNTVWDVIKVKIPELEKQLQALLKEND
jgi:uncharacterized protein with HEPN domain